MEENLYSDDARLYLQMMQENIARMASNSANSKTWLVTIVAAFLAIGCRLDEMNYWLLLALVPVLVLWYLDSYYLGLERALRNRERKFINIVNGRIQGIVKDNLYDFTPYYVDKDNLDLGYKGKKCQMFNKSVWPLYIIMIAIVVVITLIINNVQCNFSFYVPAIK